MNRMTQFGSVVLTSLAILVGACGGGGDVPVRYGAEQNPAADFSTDRKFAFALRSERPPSGFHRMYVGTEIMERRIERRVRQSLEAKGFSEVGREEADFVVFYGLGARDQVDPGAAGEGWSSSIVNVHGRATLILDFVTADGEHLWHGYADGALSEDAQIDYEAVVNTVVDEIMSRFDPPPAAETAGGEEEIEGAEEGGEESAEAEEGNE